MMRSWIYILVLFGCAVEPPPEVSEQSSPVTSTLPDQDQSKLDASPAQVMDHALLKRAPDAPDATLKVVPTKRTDQIYTTLPEMKERASPRHRLSDFAGADTCKKCHAQAYEHWSKSAHGLAGGVPNKTTVVAPFDGKPIRFADAVVTPKKIGARYVFEVVEGTSKPVIVNVAGVVGRGLMKGGGTQVYLQRQNDGRVLMLPFDYSITDKRWFCQAKRGNGWEFITTELKIGDCEWPPWRGLGVTGGPNCQNCHASQVEVTWEGMRGDYKTRWKSLTIDCESCHGPGKAHVQMRTQKKADIDPMRTLRGMTNKESLDLCFRCHATKSVTSPGYLSGQNFNEHYAHTHLIDSNLAALDAEGQIKEFAYQEGHLSSPCYTQGAMVCTDCHTAHGLTYQDVHGNPLSGWDDDGQCTGCHVDLKGANPVHGSHPSDTRCVSCHMPYRQHPGVGASVSYARSDHRISTPVEWMNGQPVAGQACLKCHAWRGQAQRQNGLYSIYGQVRPRDPRIGQLKALESVPLSTTYMTADARITEALELFSRALDWPITRQVRILTSLGRMLLVTGARPLSVLELERLTSLLTAMSFETKSAGAAILLLLSEKQPDAGQYVERVLASVRSESAVGFRRTTAFNLVGLWMSYGFSNPQITQRLVRVVRRFAPQLDSSGARVELFAARTLAAVGDAEGSFQAYLNALATPAFYGAPIPLDKAGSPRTIFKEMTSRFLETKPELLSELIERLPPFMKRDVEVIQLKCRFMQKRMLHAKALACFDDVAKRFPDRRGIHFHRANVLLKLSRQGDALRALEKGLANEPNDRQANELYEFLKMKNWEKAR